MNVPYDWISACYLHIMIECHLHVYGHVACFPEASLVHQVIALRNSSSDQEDVCKACGCSKLISAAKGCWEWEGSLHGSHSDKWSHSVGELVHPLAYTPHWGWWLTLDGNYRKNRCHYSVNYYYSWRLSLMLPVVTVQMGEEPYQAGLTAKFRLQVYIQVFTIIHLLLYITLFSWAHSPWYVLLCYLLNSMK